MEQMSTLNTTEPIDYDNLNIVIRPLPPRRRQSGISLVPFRPYVKCLTSVRKSFSFANGKDPWMTIGETDAFFKQENARCIGSLIDDCDTSDVIRWDIPGESTRLPMMCKLWIIADGAVVERGKPHLVQDAAIQVFTAGRNHRSILGTEQRYRQTSVSTFDRRRRHSWYDVNEYHSVPYYQYTRSVRSGNQEGVQCDMDNEHLISIQHCLPFVKEETVDEHQSTRMEEHYAEETVHYHRIPEHRAHVSIITQTERQSLNKSTETDYEFIKLFNLDLETNKNLLSSIVNPYVRTLSSYHDRDTRTMIRNGIKYSNQSVSTGDDYPLWWVQLSTHRVLSDFITYHDEQQNTNLTFISSKQQDQSIQTVTEQDTEIERVKYRTSSSIESSPIRNSSSSVIINNHYEIIDKIDDGNNARRLLPWTYHHRQKIGSYGDLDPHLSDSQCKTSSICENDRLRQERTLSKYSDTGYNSYASTVDQSSCSTLSPCSILVPYRYYTNTTNQRIQTKSSENTSTAVLATLFERYERTLRERQQPIAIVNNELLNIDDIIKHYREKLRSSITTKSNTTAQLYQDIFALSSQSKEECPSSSELVNHLTKIKYRSIPNRTPKEMLKGYIPSPRIFIPNSILSSLRRRQPRFDYCDLYLNDYDKNSLRIRYNEQHIDQIRKRIDLMLQNDDNEEIKFLLSNLDPITKRTGDNLMRKSKRRNHITNYYDRILLPHRCNFRLPCRLNQPLSKSSRLLTRNIIRSTPLISKSVRISTNHDYIPNKTHLHKQTSSLKTLSRPTVSVLRRNYSTLTPRLRRLVEPSHRWKSNIDRTVYILEQFSIPRYYRLYTDVTFREIYNFSHILQSYLNHNLLTSKDYSSIIKNFALEQQLPTITSVA
ncbi:unnamed protein product [Rotaria sordida]|uniref:Uncharacterized protein n=1 Tax=Rotaria sordida TaxID=392033 RepID=A0A814SV69_9BILA|nr:unnamed protein product [Rotaria sordida]CAF3567031.1 unnamed protein product [Rotaria sordida]